MPLVDMPLEKLKKYQGINPKPADFEQYWEKALKELDETAPNVKMTKADFQPLHRREELLHACGRH